MRGRIESLAKDVLRGWAWDPTRPADRLRVQFLIDGVPPTTVVADTLRQDLKSAGIGDGGHGVRLILPAALLDDATRTVVLQVVQGDGHIVDLDRRPIAFARAAALTGRVERCQNGRCIGWVWDQGQPAARIAVQLVSGGRIVATVTADRFRKDLLAAGIGDGRHGFEIPLPIPTRRDANTDRILAIQTREGQLVGMVEVPAENRAATMIERGREAYRDGDKNAARKHFDKALDLSADHVDALWMRARIAFELGEQETGRALARRVLDLQPGHQRAIVLLGRSVFSEGDHQRAAALWRQVEPGDAAYRESLIKQARSLQHLGRPLDMIKPGLAALGLNPRDLDAHRLLADAYLALGSSRLAERHLRALALARPEDGKIANQLQALRRVERPMCRIDPAWEIFENPTLRNWTGPTRGTLREATEVAPGVMLRPGSARGTIGYAVAEPQEFCAGDLPHYGLRVTAKGSAVELVCRLRHAAGRLLSQGVRYGMEARSLDERTVGLQVMLALHGAQTGLARKLAVCKAGPRPRLFPFTLLLPPEEETVFATGHAWLIIRIPSNREVNVRIPRPLSTIVPAGARPGGPEGPALTLLDRLWRAGPAGDPGMATETAPGAGAP